MGTPSCTGEEAIALDKIPSKVRAVMEREIFGGKIVEVCKESSGGETEYEAKALIDGKVYELEISSDGVLLSKELDEEQEMCWNFDDAKAGPLPSGWKIAETSGHGNLGEWKIVADPTAPSKPNCMALVKTENVRRTYNLAIAKETSYRDVEIELMVKALTGVEDQGGGPIWRAKDADNYYIARWNPLEDNFRVYYVKDGKRSQLASVVTAVDPKAWHCIEIEHTGNRIKAVFDDDYILEFDDNTFSDAGMIGLWTKADAATAFDDLEVEAAD